MFLKKSKILRAHSKKQKQVVFVETTAYKLCTYQTSDYISESRSSMRVRSSSGVEIDFRWSAIFGFLTAFLLDWFSDCANLASSSSAACLARILDSAVFAAWACCSPSFVSEPAFWSFFAFSRLYKMLEWVDLSLQEYNFYRGLSKSAARRFLICGSIVLSEVRWRYLVKLEVIICLG